MKVKFLKSAVGSHSLGYLAGEVATLADDLGKELVKQGVAEEVKPTKVKRTKRTAESKEVQKAIKR